MSRIRRPLDPAAAKAADDKFYAAHPEMVQDGKRVPIDPSNPDHAAYVDEWKAEYRAEQAAEDGRPIDDPVQPCDDKPWIEIELFEPDGSPRRGEAYRVEDPTGKVFEGTLDGAGRARLQVEADGNCKVTFPMLDRRLWARRGDKRPDGWKDRKNV